MGDEEGAPAVALAEGEEILIELVPGEGIEGTERFIEEEQARLEGEGAGEGGAHTHATAELMGKAVEGIGEADAAGPLIGDGVSLWSGFAAQAEGKGDIIAEAGPWEQVGVLKDKADLIGGDGALDLAGGGLKEAGDEAEEGGFAATGGPEDCQ